MSDGGKGSARRPGEGYGSGWDAIFGKREGECKCTFSQRMVGDGCDVCNPELAEQFRREAEQDELESAPGAREV